MTQRYVEPDAHLRIPFKRGVLRSTPPPRKRNRVKGFQGHIGSMSHESWRLARKAATK